MLRIKKKKKTSSSLVAAAVSTPPRLNASWCVDKHGNPFRRPHHISSMITPTAVSSVNECIQQEILDHSMKSDDDDDDDYTESTNDTNVADDDDDDNQDDRKPAAVSTAQITRPPAIKYTKRISTIIIRPAVVIPSFQTRTHLNNLKNRAGVKSNANPFATGFDKKVGYNPELHDYELIENTKFWALIEENRKRKAPILESSPQIFVARHQQPHPLPPRDNSNHDITDYKYYFPINSDGVFDLVSSDDDDDNKSDEERDRILKVTWMSELAGPPDWLRVFNSRVGDDLYFIIEQSDNNNIISDVHIIEDYKKGQVYIIKTLTANHHFQFLLPSITGYLDQLKSSTRIKFYPNNGNHMNDFCVVLNEHKSTAPILDLIDFHCVDDRLDNVSSDKAGGATRQAQHTRESFGSATSQCMSRNSSGATYPKLLKGTEDPFVKRIFVALSMIFKIDSIPDWAKYVSIPPFQEHAKKIDEKNEIDACTLHKSGRKNLLQDHVDANNPNSTAANKRSVVVGASKWVNNNRVGATGYLRRSICESIKREKVMLPLLLQLKSAYLAFAENRRQCNFDIFKKSALMGNVIDRDHFSVACNINPLGFHSLWIHCVCILIYSYQLSYPAVISVLSCKDVMPNTAYFFSLAVYELVLGKVEFSGDPILLGRCISIRMIQHRDEYYARMGTTKKSVLRYASYNKKSVADIPSELEWYQQVMQKTVVFLFISSTYNKRPNLSNIDRIHNVLSAMVQDCMSGVGPLGALHSICILSKFSILPYWTGTYGCLQGRVLKRIQEKFPKITFVGNAGRSTMTAIITFLHSELGIKWSYNELENFFCKFDRITTGPSRRSSDSFFLIAITMMKLLSVTVMMV